jgi:hypothetical protein
MKKTVLEKLFDGEIYPSENILIDTAESRDIMERIKTIEADIFETLPESSRENYDKIEELRNIINVQYSYEYFSYGFRLAVALIVGVKSDIDNTF